MAFKPKSISGGSGDVVGPISAIDERIAVFDGITGKLIKDGGKTIAETLARANHTGTQTASTISDFDTEVANNSAVALNTDKLTSMWETDGTETQLITADEIDMQSKKIINLTDPTANQDGATKKYVDDNASPIPSAADSMLLASSDAEAFSRDLEYIKLKEIQIGKTGTYRIKWEMQNDGDLDNTPWVRSKIYTNDVASGVEKTTYVAAYNDYEETSFSVNAGDKISLYGKVNWYNQTDGYPICRVKNFRIYATEFDITLVIL